MTWAKEGSNERTIRCAAVPFLDVCSRDSASTMSCLEPLADALTKPVPSDDAPQQRAFERGNLQMVMATTVLPNRR